VLRPNAHRGKVRECNFVPVSDCAVASEKAWRGTGEVFGLPAGAGQSVCRGRKVKPSEPIVCGRRWAFHAAILVALSLRRSSWPYDTTPSGNGTCADRRGWRHIGQVDFKSEPQRAGREITPSSWVATGTMVRTAVRVARIGTTLLRIRTTTLGLGASVPTLIYRSADATARQADHASLCGQPDLSCFGKHTTGFGIAPITENGKARPTSMGKRNRNLYEKITSWPNLVDALHKTSNGKRKTWGYLEWKEYGLANLRLLQKELQDKTYTCGDYREFTIFEPKPRQISALDFKDRIVQHAICNIIQPIFETGFLPYTFACRPGMGTHAGVKHIQSLLRKTNSTHYLQTDFSKFFPSVDHEILYRLKDKKIHCDDTRWLMRRIVPDVGVGIKIGSLCSQLDANIYGSPVDNLVHHGLGHRHWARYMDDIVILGNDQDELRETFNRIEEFSLDRLKLKISRWHIAPTSHGIDFLGYRIWKNHKLLRKRSVVRAKRKIANFVRFGDMDGLNKFAASWRGHARWADAENLFTWMEKKYELASY